MTDEQRPLVIAPPIELALCRDHAMLANRRAPVDQDEPATRARPGLVLIGVVELALREEKIAQACGQDPTTGTGGDVKRLTGVLIEFSPLCCLVGEEKFAKLVEAVAGGAEIFRAWRRDELGVTDA